MKGEKAIDSEEKMLLTYITDLKLLLNELCQDCTERQNDEVLLHASQLLDKLILEHMRLKIKK